MKINCDDAKTMNCLVKLIQFYYAYRSTNGEHIFE